MRSRERNSIDTHGNVHFVTSTIAGFVPVFINDRLCDVFVNCLRFYQRRGDFTLLAWVLMPNHFHLIITRHPERSISEIVGNIKRYTSRGIQTALIEMGMEGVLSELRSAAAREPSSDVAVWKPRFDSLVIFLEETLKQKITYVHANPVRKGLVAFPTDWRYSSARNYAELPDTVLEVDTDWQGIGGSKIPSGTDS